MRIKTIMMTVFVTATIAGSAAADTIIFRNGATLEGRMLGSDDTHVRFEANGMVGNYSRDDVVAIDIGTLSQTTKPPYPEPGTLDVPTAWQEGDPEPVDATVPEVEPEQQSSEAPPSQPMEDECGDAPGPQHVWVTGYWWWYGGSYMWAPGYWFIPPYPAYVYIPGYWTYMGGYWVYVRGGWGHPYDHVVVMYAGPRPYVHVSLFPWPHRIVHRHAGWHHHHHRHADHTTYRSPASDKAKSKYKNPRRGTTGSTARDRYNQRRSAKTKRSSTNVRRRSTSGVKPTQRAPSARKPRQTTRGTQAPKVNRSRPSKPRTGSKPKASKPRSSSRPKSTSKPRSNSSRKSSGSNRRRN